MYPKPPNRNSPSKMQTALKDEAQEHTGQGAQAVSALPAPNKTIGPPDNLEIRATHPGSAAQVAQHMSETAKPAKHHGMNQQNMFLGKKLSIYTENQHRTHLQTHIRHWHKPADREIAHKRWMNRLPDASEIQIHIPPPTRTSSLNSAPTGKEKTGSAETKPKFHLNNCERLSMLAASNKN